ncbi:hypothetical protein PC41400_08045 [Paenibacillus chitinolyticus]|uniref:Uncharacterized protein n=1 Tax=Paenibacillus chitinolyticus TaxID=79263 RepID=A0A410WTM3_9BACL|nr:hypothetical protein [Paenibacillus chitinolyticus]MCY9594036.1 hypothetical protein [Paenibacillus chitinolyticus]MCY9599141.1 hypothetical protein [Paenibacillus chitinolyticus]QAV17617.1 hypothetical protein PC41400_08045 [Paenibacillus chitinolyticus]
MTKTKMIRVVNNMPTGSLGIVLTDGKPIVLPKPGNYKEVSFDNVLNIFNSCKLIQRGHLYIDNKDVRIEFGLEDGDQVDINALSREELGELVKESDAKQLEAILAADTSDGTKEKIVLLAREQYNNESMDAKKVKVIETATGMSVTEEAPSESETTKSSMISKK